LFEAAKAKAKGDLEKKYPPGPVKIVTDAVEAERLYYKKDPPERWATYVCIRKLKLCTLENILD
jgi:hypothetical protein